MYLRAGTDTIGRPAGWGAEQFRRYIAERYHQPSDEYDPAWNLDGMVEDARFALLAGVAIANDDAMPQWNPGGVALARVDATHWTITFTGKETTQIEYKYTLGDWDHVEKDSACGEIANRQLTLSYGATGTQTVNDNVPNWRNVAPCGN